MQHTAGRSAVTYRPPTPAQIIAMTRNFRIFRLRGLHSQLSMLAPDRRVSAQAIVDEELKSLGAETEADRRARMEAEQCT
jgi:hypothetical protein